MKKNQIFALTLGTVISLFSLSHSIASTSQLVLPVAKNPIVNKSMATGLVITYAAAENNVDPATHNPIADRLQLTLKNVSSKSLSRLEVYYLMTDVVTKAKEGYYQKLTGVTIAPKKSMTVYFDGGKQADHYPENQFSLYRSSQNQVNFKIWVSAPGVKIAQATALKSTGTGEKPGA